MKISILTLFPEMFASPMNHSILKIAQQKEKIIVDYVNIRDFGIGKHRLVDDTPYGGGVGMVMRVDVVDAALRHARCKTPCNERVILLDPQGKKFDQKTSGTLSKLNHLILICGRYEGIDERIHTLIDEEISIGDYVLTGGEIPALVLVDSITRLLPGVLGKDASSKSESFQETTIKNQTVTLLEYPHYTKPLIYNNQNVPEILLSGNHKKILEWREKQVIVRTKNHRPDLLLKRV